MEEIGRITYNNWHDSAIKWIKIVNLVKEGQKFNSKRGFPQLNVIGTCGYCLQYHPLKHACSLYKIKINNLSVCCACILEFPPQESYFFLFVQEMTKKNPDLEKALKYAEIILKAIMEDCSDNNVDIAALQEQAGQYGDNFESINEMFVHGY